MMYNATEHHTRVMADLLLTKSAEEMDTNLEDSTVGVNPDQYPDPEGRGKGTADAPWGEPNTKGMGNNAVQLSDATLQGIVQSRSKILAELFDSVGPAATAEQKLVGQQLECGASGDYESRSPLLVKSASDRTLADLTRGLLG